MTKKSMTAALVAGVALSWAPAALAGDASQDAMFRIDQKESSRPRNGSSDEAMFNIHQQVWHRASSEAPVVYTDQARGIWNGTPDSSPYVVVDMRTPQDRMAKSAAGTQGTGAAEPATAQ